MKTSFDTLVQDIFGFDPWSTTPEWTTSRIVTFPERTISNKVKNDICSASYPPSNIEVLDDKSLFISIAVPGMKKEMFDVEFIDDYLKVSLKKEEEKAETEDEEKTAPKSVYLQKGIKDFKSTIKFYVDPMKFDASKITAKYEDGILSFLIKKSERVAENGKIDIL
jgi:HSP20 family molecular chaperone IbpA